MTDETSPRLGLPLIAAGQAQKHITHNEALMELDALVHLSVNSILSAPPGSPAANVRHLIGSSPTGAWAGKTNQIAAYQDGAWVYYTPQIGWIVYVQDVAQLQVFNGTAWVTSIVGALDNVPRLGVNTTANSTTKFISKSDANLFDQVTGSARVTVNKTATGDTASLVFQKAFSGRAEFGLMGVDTFGLKVSADGTLWKTALATDTAGCVSFPSGVMVPNGRNLIINGGFDVWQRGTSFAVSTPFYTADRWCCWRGGYAVGATVSRSSDVPSSVFAYSFKLQRDSGNTAVTDIQMNQGIESASMRHVAGGTVTVSFWAKAGAHFSAASSTLNVVVRTGTGVDQSTASYGSWAGAAALSSTVTLSTSWTRYTLTFTLGSTVSEALLQFYCVPVGTAGADDSVYITGIQLEAGAYASAYERRAIGQELALCQRYYQQLGGRAAGVGEINVIGYNGTGASIMASFVLPVEMRAAPTATKVGTWYAANCGQPSIGFATSQMFTMTSSVTSGPSGAQFASNATTTYVTLSAEL